MKNSDKIILDLCGGRLGNWSKPYKDAGYDVRVVDILTGGDVLTYKPPKNVYGVLVAPPCTMFSLARTNAELPRDFRGGMKIVQACLRIIHELQYEPVSKNAKYTRLKFWALENPNRGLLKNFIGKPPYIFHPYEFGDMYKKETAIWGNFNFPEKEISEQHGKVYIHTVSQLKKFDSLKSREIHPEQFGKLSRTERRSITPAGFAKAFYKANQ